MTVPRDHGASAGHLGLSKPVVPLADCGTLAPELVGGKARLLGEMTSQGLPVPEGICVTTHAWRLFSADTDVGAAITRMHAEIDARPALLGDCLAGVRRSIRTVAFPPGLRAALLLAGGPLLAGEPVIVRSSATGEDAHRASSAGIYDSVPDVRDEHGLLAAIRQVYASAFSERANFYRGTGPFCELAIVIQRQVSGPLAGVLFTTDPLTLARGPVVAASASRDAATRGDGATSTDLLSLDPGHPLTPYRAELLALASAARSAIGRPADVEFVISAGRPVPVQVRPMTAMASRGDEGDRAARVRWAAQEDVAAVRALPLGRCDQLMARQLMKHIPYRKVCAALGVPLYELFYLSYHWDSLGEELLPFMAQIPHDMVSVNWGRRSLRTPLADLASALLSGRLENVVGHRTTTARVGSIIPAERMGNAAVAGSGEMIIEVLPVVPAGQHEPDTAAERLVIPRHARGSDRDHQLPKDIAERVGEITRSLTAHLGPVCIEWKEASGTVYVTDMSIVRRGLKQPHEQVLSPGLLRGRTLVIPDASDFDTPGLADAISVTEYKDRDEIANSDGRLRELLAQVKSLPEPPVIVTTYPAIGLAPLVPYVSGFIFARGNLLCHLAILLREREVPAYLYPAAAELGNGDPVQILSSPDHARADTCDL